MESRASNNRLPVQLVGTVVHGQRRGRQLGFPTANIQPERDVALPEFGVYAGRVNGQVAAINVGVRPHFDDGPLPTIEAHVLNFEGDLYGRQVVVEFIQRLREERRFPTIDDLCQQMRADVQATREAVSSWPPPSLPARFSSLGPGANGNEG